MPVASIARPISPPSASISRTRCPFAVPPTAGLHGMCATVSGDSVQRPTRAPRRAAAYAASHPACPAPITITSKSDVVMSLFPNAEPREDMRQQFVRRALARDLLEGGTRLLKIRQHEFFRQRPAVPERRRAGANHRV